MHGQRIGLLSLPVELICHILNDLDIPDLVNCTLVSPIQLFLTVLIVDISSGAAGKMCQENHPRFLSFSVLY